MSFIISTLTDPANLLTSLKGCHDPIAQNILIADVIKQFGARLRTDRPFKLELRVLFRLQPEAFEKTLAWMDVDFLRPVWGELVLQDQSHEDHRENARSFILAREGWECVFSGVQGYLAELFDMGPEKDAHINVVSKQLERLEEQKSGLDAEMRPCARRHLHSVESWRGWKRAQLDSKLHDWWWYA